MLRHRAVLLIARETGWTPDVILALPLADFHHYIDLITKTDE